MLRTSKPQTVRVSVLRLKYQFHTFTYIYIFIYFIYLFKTTQIDKVLVKLSLFRVLKF
jgi:hypothetical protein